MAFRCNNGIFQKWQLLKTETYHSEKTGKDYVSAVFLDSDGYRKVCRIAEGIRVEDVEAACGQTCNVFVTCVAAKDYSFLVFEGFCNQ